MCALINIFPTQIATKLTDSGVPPRASDVRPLIVVAVVLLKAGSQVLNLLFTGSKIVSIPIRGVKGSPPIYRLFSPRKKAIFIK